MRILFLLILLISFSSHAQEICKNYKPELTDRDNEDWHSKESALNALNFLEMYIKNEGKARNTDPWWATGRVEGAMLKIAALEANADPKSNEYLSYCRFVTRQGVHREQ